LPWWLWWKILYDRGFDLKHPELRGLGYKEYNKQWREKRKELALGESDRAKARRRNYEYERKYGITTSDYEALITEQDGLCAICREPCVTGKRLSVDHDHKTGQIRGLLCYQCNVGLGNFKDRKELLESAVRYLS
jgi:hypothetical protein